MKIRLYVVFLLLPALSFGQIREEVNKKLYNSASFTVPSSPAFELLPDKASEVTHLVTSHDLTTNVLPLFMNGTTLQQGLSFDGRPFIYFVGTLKEYQERPLKRILARTVLSAGTAPIGKTDNMFVSTGIRIPLIDKSDPRNDAKYIEKVEGGYIKALDELGQPPLNASKEILEARRKYASSKIDTIRTNFANEVWNAWKLDIGGALMYKATESKLDALNKNSSGLWLAGSIPFRKQTQLILSGKSTWTKADSAKQETSRTVVGGKLRFFGKKYKIGFSAEVAYVWSVYEEATDMNQSWPHYAAIVEFPIPKLDSYLGLVLGFDGERKEGSDPKVEFKYAIYTDRLVKK